MAHGDRHPTNMMLLRRVEYQGDGALAFAIDEMTQAFATWVRGNDVRLPAT
jgi:hypothetical protein